MEDITNVKDFDALLDMVKADSGLVDSLTDEQVTELRKKINPYGKTVENGDKLTCLSITNLSEQYMKKFLMTSLIGFLYRQCDEHKMDDGEPVVPMDDFELFMEKYNQAKEAATESARWMSEFNTNKGVCSNDDDEDNERVIKENALLLEHQRVLDRFDGFKSRLVVRKFLDTLFQYNPDYHVRSAYSENPLDPERVVPEQVAKTKTKSMVGRDGSKVELPNKDESDHPDFKRSTSKFVKHIPPSDTFHRWTYYTDCNYEEIRSAVQDLYCEKPDLEFAINPYGQFDDRESSDKFIQKHKEEVIADICTLTNGKWNLCGSFKKNRERINFYNEKTAVIEEIFKQLETDKKLGAELMRKRVRRKKEKNIEECGPDPEMLADYKKNNPSGFEMLGAEDCNAEDEPVRGNVPHEDCPYDAVQVDIFDFRNGGTDVSKSEFFTEAVDPSNTTTLEDLGTQ